MVFHYLLTRFNLSLWNKDKKGRKIDKDAWIERRMSLFESYCLPSVTGQKCQNFIWVLLVDEDTPEGFRQAIKVYSKTCPQIKLIGVKAHAAAYFPKIFQKVVIDDLKNRDWKDGDLCLTTYLDNDDSIHQSFVDEVQKRCQCFNLKSDERRFLSFDYGLQLFTELGNFCTRVFYPNNHFITLAERLSDNGSLNYAKIRTCYGYGSHFLLEQNKMLKVCHVDNAKNPMWIEVVHGENVDNDVKMTLHTRIVSDPGTLCRDFSLSLDVDTDHVLDFSLRAIKQVLRRTKNKFT